MTPGVFLLLALAGGLGAAARFMLDGAVRARLGNALPWGTIAINLSGSLLLGVVTGLTGRVLPEAVALVLGGGFLGGYTTFSTASIETVRLLQERRVVASLLNGVGVLVIAVAAALVGYLLARPA